MRVVLIKEQGSERLAHVPLDVIGEHAQEDVATHPVGTVMVDGTNLEIDGLDAAESVLYGAEVFVALVTK